MGNPASRLGCLGQRPRGSGTGSVTEGGPCPPTGPRGPRPPEIPWTWWGPRAVQVTEVTETVVTETVVTEAVEVLPCRQGVRPAEVPPAPLDTLCRWLDGMEELQASQGPLAADAALAAAQLREQELLLRLLRERMPQLEPVLREAGSPAELCTRWHRLVEQAESRRGILEQIVRTAQSFEVAREVLLRQLSPGEGLLAEVQLGSRDLEDVLQHLQCVWEDAVVRAMNMERALETGQRLAELLTESQAQLVRQQLTVLQKRVRSVESCAAWVQQKLLCTPRTGVPKPLAPVKQKAQTAWEGSASACPGLKAEMQLSVQLALLAERLEQLAERAEAPSLTVKPTVIIWEPNLLPAVPRAKVGPWSGHWTGAQEQDTRPMAVWEPAERIWRSVAKQKATEEELKSEGDQNPALQEFLCREQTLALSWLRRGPALRGGAAHRGTCPLDLLMELLGCRAAVSSPSRDRLRTLEEILLLVGHLVTKLLVHPHGLVPPHRLGQTEHLGTTADLMDRGSNLDSDFADQQVVQAQGWELAELPVAWRGAMLNHCSGAPGEALVLRGPDQEWSGDLGSRAQACLLGKSPEELGWKRWWAEDAMGNWSHQRSKPSKRSWEDRHQWTPLQRQDGFPIAGEQDRDGASWSGHNREKCRPASQFPAMLGSGFLFHGQQQPHSMARARGTEGMNTPVAAQGQPTVPGALAARGALMVRVGGGWAALDEFLVKNDPGRVKGRTSQKIHERFLCWAPPGPVPEVIALRFWASIHMASGRPQSRKTGLPSGQAHRAPTRSRPRCHPLRTDNP